MDSTLRNKKMVLKPQMENRFKLEVLGQDELTALRSNICADATDEELQLFAYVCSRSGLDPFLRQIYAIKRKGKMTIQISIDGMRLLSEQTGKYCGMIGPWFCDKDGKWQDVWTKDYPPHAAKVGILQTDFLEPVYGVATFSEYAQVFFDYQKRENKLGEMWQKMPATMLAKCAESLARRKAFPFELSGLYTAEEMQQSENTGSVTDLRLKLPADLSASLMPEADSLCEEDTKTLKCLLRQATALGVIKPEDEQSRLQMLALGKYTPEKAARAIDYLRLEIEKQKARTEISAVV